MEIKYYPITQSPFYKLTSKSKLAKILLITNSELSNLKSDNNYRCFVKDGRDIQSPRKELKLVHKRIKKLLCKIEPPNYLFSSVKKRSSVLNAKYHIDNDYFLVTDIKGFYKSTKKEYVFRLFKYMFKMVDDVAWAMTDLCCFSNFVPTGSPSSQIVAYWTHHNIFNFINNFCMNNDIKFSIYVDDLTFSSKNKISREVLSKIKYKLSDNGLITKESKTKYLGKQEVKKITGCGIKNNQLLTLNKHMKLLRTHMKKYHKSPQKVEIRNTINGLLTYIQTINKSVFNDYKKSIE